VGSFRKNGVPIVSQYYRYKRRRWLRSSYFRISGQEAAAFVPGSAIHSRLPPPPAPEHGASATTSRISHINIIFEKAQRVA
jgi:hypothetical protein